MTPAQVNGAVWRSRLAGFEQVLTSRGFIIETTVFDLVPENPALPTLRLRIEQPRAVAKRKPSAKMRRRPKCAR